MPEKEGAEEKTTKSVVNKKQKQMMGEEGYDVARDEGRVRPSKDKKDATSYPVSDEMKKTQKVNTGLSALELVKKKYGKAVMDIKKEELDLTKVAEAFGGNIVEKAIVTTSGSTSDIDDFIKAKDPFDYKKKNKNNTFFDRVTSNRDSRIDYDNLSGKEKEEFRKITKEFEGKPKVTTTGGKEVKPRKPFRVTGDFDRPLTPFDKDLGPKKTSVGGSTYASRGKYADRQKGLDRFTDLRKQKKLQNLKKSFKTFRKMPALQQLKTVGQGIGRGVGSMSKATAKVARNLTKGGLKAVGKKTIGRALGKGLAKQIPGLGQILSGGEAIMRFAKGDVIGGALSTLEMIPGLGLLAGTANVARDVKRATTVARNIKKLKPLTKNMKLVKNMPGAKTMKDIASPYGKVGTFLRKNKLKTALGAGGVAFTADAIGDRMRRPNIKPSTPQGGMVGRRSAGSFTAA